MSQACTEFPAQTKPRTNRQAGPLELIGESSCKDINGNAFLNGATPIQFHFHVIEEGPVQRYALRGSPGVIGDQLNGAEACGQVYAAGQKEIEARLRHYYSEIHRRDR